MPTKSQSKVGWDGLRQCPPKANQKLIKRPTKTRVKFTRKEHHKKQKTKAHQTPKPTPAKGQVKPAQHQPKTLTPATAHQNANRKVHGQKQKRGNTTQKINASPPECVWKLSQKIDPKSIQNGVWEVPGGRPRPPQGLPRGLPGADPGRFSDATAN